jgi:hypothetical protein
LVVDPTIDEFPYRTNLVNYVALTRYPAALRRGGSFLLLGADFSCYFFNYLEYLDKETQKIESRVNSFNVGYVMLGVAPYLSIGFNIMVGE